MPLLARTLYHALIAVGGPFGGIRPRRLYDVLGRKAYPHPELSPPWTRNRWGHELRLSHHFHLDRNILIYGDYDHELHLLLQSRIKAGMVVLDVGANLGEMSLHAAALAGKAGAVHAFEPYPPAFTRLQEHIERNQMVGQIYARRLALSNHPGTVKMSVPDADSDNQGIGSIVHHDAGRTPRTVEIQATTLDAFVLQEKIPRIDFIKLDIQGAEIYFLEGGAQTLRAHRPQLVMEVSPADLRSVGKTSRDLLSLVESMGYDIYQVHHGQATTRIVAADISEHFEAVNVLCLPS